MINTSLCDSNICTGCKACINVCAKGAVTVEDRTGSFAPQIDASKCIDCGLCAKVCPNNSPRQLKDIIYGRQGWATDELRCSSSSGGAASELIREFIGNGGYVASCLFENGEFRFDITNDLSRARKFAGSKYVKSNPHLIYKEIKDRLGRGDRVLFIGLPCQSAAVQNVCGDCDNLFTADLICHGTPSVQLLCKYLAEKGIDLDKARDVRFRNDNNFGLVVDGNRLVCGTLPDHYTYGFLKAINYTECCNNCRYAASQRVSDITLGDAWGLLADTDANGVSLILCQTEKGKVLIEHADLELFDVDMEKAMAANPQLNHPAAKPRKRDWFFEQIGKGRSVSEATEKAFVKYRIKRLIKNLFEGRRTQK